MSARALMRWTMAAAYAAIGVVHLTSPEALLPIVPGWVPRPRDVVLATGVLEIAGAIGLLVPRLRRPAGLMLALYAFCVWPANIKHAVEGIVIPSLPTSWWYHGPRLAFQPVLIWWALFSAGVIDWPLPRSRRRSEAATAYRRRGEDGPPS